MPQPTAPLIGAENCNSCKFSYVATLPGVPPVGYCRRFPPTASAMVVGMDHKTGPQWVRTSGHPNVKPEWWCGEYRRSLISAVPEGNG